MTHVLLKSSVAIPSKDKLQETLRTAVPTLEQMAKHAEDNYGLTHRDLEKHPEWRKVLTELVTEHGRQEGAPQFSSGVYSIPFFNPQYVEDILMEVASMSFEVNDEEDALVQIPEFTLQDKCPSLFTCMHSLFNYAIKPLSTVLFGLEPAHMQSIQFAQYTPENTSKGHWHHDKDSDITLVAALTNNHLGGGTRVKPQGLGEPFDVPQLPVGHALLFQGSRNLHYGLPVTDGARNLLVFWNTLRP